MINVSLIFPHQIFKRLPNNFLNSKILIIEEHLFFNHYSFHIQKLTFHRLTLQNYKIYLENNNFTVEYISSQDSRCDVRNLIPSLCNDTDNINFIDPVDFYLSKRIKESCIKNKLKFTEHESPSFLNSNEENNSYFSGNKKLFRHSDFYKKQRTRLNILMINNKPQGDKWSFDEENRKKYPKEKIPPKINQYNDENFLTIQKEMKELFPNHLGKQSSKRIYPSNFIEAEKWLDDFLNERFIEFGIYEDAIHSDEIFLNHSILSPLINSGLLTPDFILERVLDFSKSNDIPLNSLEGFIRQIIGWREFMRGLYISKGIFSRNLNFWNFTKKIPKSFYSAETGILPVDDTINKINNTSYCHHIERLMIIGNFMLLCEFDPDEVHKWFMELFIDAYDWVMVPNVYGMSQFADGGLFSTKPYISSSNYIIKMSNYKKGEWSSIWDGLFWRFMDKHREKLKNNPRLNMLIKNFDKMDNIKRNNHLIIAEKFLKKLEV